MNNPFLIHTQWANQCLLNWNFIFKQDWNDLPNDLFYKQDGGANMRLSGHTEENFIPEAAVFAKHLVTAVGVRFYWKSYTHLCGSHGFF